MGPVTPSARRAPRTKVVLPAPSSPDSRTTSPGRSSRANAAPSASVSSADAVCSAGSAIGDAAPQRQPRQEQQAATGRGQPGLGAGAWQRGGGGGRARRGGGRARARLGRRLVCGRAGLRCGRALGLLLRPVGERVLVLVVAGALREGGRREG